MMGVICPFCKTDFDPTQADPGDSPGTVLCPTCFKEMNPAEAENTEAGSPPPPLSSSAEQTGGREDPGHPPVWELTGGDLLTKFWLTIKQMLFQPAAAMSPPGPAGNKQALIFAIIAYTAGAAAGVAGSWVFWPEELDAGLSPIMRILLAPVLVIVFVYVGALVLHCLLILAGGANNGFKATLRVLCYAQATSLFYVIPWAGPYAAIIWALYIQIAGLAAAQKTTRGRAAFAVLTPVVLVLGLALWGMLSIPGEVSS